MPIKSSTALKGAYFEYFFSEKYLYLWSNSSMVCYSTQNLSRHGDCDYMDYLITDSCIIFVDEDQAKHYIFDKELKSFSIFSVLENRTTETFSFPLSNSIDKIEKSKKSNIVFLISRVEAAIWLIDLDHLVVYEDRSIWFIWGVNSIIPGIDYIYDFRLETIDDQEYCFFGGFDTFAIYEIRKVEIHYPDVPFYYKLNFVSTTLIRDARKISLSMIENYTYLFAQSNDFVEIYYLGNLRNPVKMNEKKTCLDVEYKNNWLHAFQSEDKKYILKSYDSNCELLVLDDDEYAIMPYNRMSSSADNKKKIFLVELMLVNLINRGASNFKSKITKVESRSGELPMYVSLNRDKKILSILPPLYESMRDLFENPLIVTYKLSIKHLLDQSEKEDLIRRGLIDNEGYFTGENPIIIDWKDDSWDYSYYDNLLNKSIIQRPVLINCNDLLYLNSKPEKNQTKSLQTQFESLYMNNVVNLTYELDFKMASDTYFDYDNDQLFLVLNKYKINQSKQSNINFGFDLCLNSNLKDVAFPDSSTSWLIFDSETNRLIGTPVNIRADNGTYVLVFTINDGYASICDCLVFNVSSFTPEIRRNLQEQYDSYTKYGGPMTDSQYYFLLKNDTFWDNDIAFRKVYLWK